MEMRARVRAVSLLTVLLVGLALPREPRAQSVASPLLTRANPGQTLAIVVNRSNPVDNLPFTELRKIFMGQRNHWANGHRIAIAMLDYGQPERRTVLRLIYRMDETAYQDSLLREMFRGDVFIAPKTLASPTILRKFVFNAPGAIGYLRSRDVDQSVKVIRIDGLLPEDEGYRLQIDEPSTGKESE
jgi:ABC-type phosphate transport system substrate-binding protein